MDTSSPTTKAGGFVRGGLWLAQAIIAAMFIMAGFMKLTTPIVDLAAMMPWAGEYSEPFVRFIGAVDLAGGIGIILPALTRIKPHLTIWAAIGCAILQVCAIIFHLSRGEANVVGLNVVLLACALFVYWGRSSKAPILPKR